MTMEMIKKWKSFFSSSKAEKNSSRVTKVRRLWPLEKKAIFSRQINPRRLGKPNGVHHELSRNRVLPGVQANSGLSEAIQ